MIHHREAADRNCEMPVNIALPDSLRICRSMPAEIALAGKGRPFFSSPTDDSRASLLQSDPLPADRLAALAGPFRGKYRCKGSLRMGNFRGQLQPRPGGRPLWKDRLDLLRQRGRTTATH